MAMLCLIAVKWGYLTNAYKEKQPGEMLLKVCLSINIYKNNLQLVIRQAVVKPV